MRIIAVWNFHWRWIRICAVNRVIPQPCSASTVSYRSIFRVKVIITICAEACVVWFQNVCLAFKNVRLAMTSAMFWQWNWHVLGLRRACKNSLLHMQKPFQLASKICRSKPQNTSVSLPKHDKGHGKTYFLNGNSSTLVKVHRKLCFRFISDHNCKHSGCWYYAKDLIPTSFWKQAARFA